MMTTWIMSPPQPRQMKTTSTSPNTQMSAITKVLPTIYPGTTIQLISAQLDAEENLEDLDIQFTLEGGDLAEDDEENDAEEEHDDESIRPIGPGLFGMPPDL